MGPVLFLHIPKTSGTSLKTFFKRTLDRFYVQANSRHQLARRDPLLGRVKDLDDVRRVLEDHAGLALHVDSDFGEVHEVKGFRSLAWMIFAPENEEFFRRLTILTMFREPFARFLSESAFIDQKQRSEPDFLPEVSAGDLWEHLDRTPENGLLQFLLFPDFLTHRSFAQADLERVKRCILEYPVHVGIYERYEESIRRFSDLLGHDFDAADLPSYNVVKEKPPVPEGLEAEFRRRNQLDIELYDFALEVFDGSPGAPRPGS